MKGLFCYDGPLIKDNFGDYYGIALNNETFSRYYSIASHLTLAISTKNIEKDDELNKYSKIDLNDLEIISLPSLTSLNGMLFSRGEVKEILIKLMTKVDFVIVRLPSFIGNMSVRIAKKLNKPCLIEMVGCSWGAYWNHSLKGKLIAPFMYYATKKNVREAEYVVYVTNEFLQKRYPTNGESTNCSNVILTQFDDTILEKRLEKINALDDSSKIIIGTIAAVDVRYKGQQYVIKAIGKLKERGITNFEYQIVGDGNQSYLKKIAKRYDVLDQVKFLGVLPHHKVFEWLDTIDIYVQPSRQEGLPRALIEAMSRGLPAFGARTAGIPELIEPEFIFSNTKKNIDEICKLIMSFNNKEIMLTQAKRNYEESKKYDKEIIERRRISFFKKFRRTFQKEPLV